MRYDNEDLIEIRCPFCKKTLCDSYIAFQRMDQQERSKILTHPDRCFKRWQEDYE